MSLKNPVIPPGKDPETVRLVAQRLNHYATPRPLEPHLSGLIGKASYPYMQKIRIIGFFFENRPHLNLEFRLLLQVCSLEAIGYTI